MKKFNFRLQRVIDVRETKEKECQRELAKSQFELKKREELLAEEQRELRSSRERLRQALHQSTNIAQLSALDGWRRWKDQAVKIQARHADQQRGVVNVKRKALIQASKEKKILERLKEKRWAEHQALTLQEEQRFLDEVAGRAHKPSSGEQPDTEMTFSDIHETDGIQQ